ncbi:hypothetical protein L596_015210 [Steinernema carpocapsae]|uniref:O-methyltransferase domain-containing protein n=1 Tax=Steinernema carpocapsae TaxID=34508 RepID=A0A4U5NEB1_STECR|nr:hypothetical protein L596_015210 [Steinernema carpocapsae]
MSQKVGKSFHMDDPIVSYCAKITVKAEPIEDELRTKTLENAASGGMVGAPEVLQLGKNFIKLIHGKKALDIGTFTGSSAFAWAFALPEDGKVISMDVSHEWLDKIGRPLIESRPEIAKKIQFKKGSALDTLDELIANGEAGTFDFAFVDADKTNYSNYYRKAMKLLRSGGVIIVDNALWGGKVVTRSTEPSTQAIQQCNELISQDENSMNALLNLGDGAHFAIKI